MNGFLSKLSENAASPIREETALAEELAKSGKQVIRLNSGDPPKYFKTPEYITKAYAAALKQNKTFYADSQGVPELRDAISKYYKQRYNANIEPESILVTQGVSEALYFINAALINPQDKAVIARPYYASYLPFLRILGGMAVFADGDEEGQWAIDTDKLRRLMRSNRKAKYLLFSTPSNPTGSILSRKEMKELVDLANEHDMLIISDEIYDEIIFGKAKFTSIAQIAKGVPYAILNGASKSFDATGFRIGYMLLPNQDKKSEALLKRAIDLARMRLSANTPAQHAIASVMNTKEHAMHVKKLARDIEARVKFAARAINKSEYMRTVEPQGGFYVFPKLDMRHLNINDDREFANKLLREKYVWLTRGSGFGAPGHVRMVALPEKDVLAEAIERIEEFCKEHSR
ncbi:MAG: pyridoxal phosphate-dependent aminotransferase [Candidatus Micrarchaeia archaeon]